jgi:hypothetical protein
MKFNGLIINLELWIMHNKILLENKAIYRYKGIIYNYND